MKLISFKNKKNELNYRLLYNKNKSLSIRFTHTFQSIEQLLDYIKHEFSNPCDDSNENIKIIKNDGTVSEFYGNPLRRISLLRVRTKCNYKILFEFETFSELIAEFPEYLI